MQTNERWQAFGERVTYDGEPHCTLERINPTPDFVLRCNERSLQVLRALASLDERRKEDPDENDPVLLELQRMDSKINILLDIVERLVLPVQALPPRRAIRLNAIGALLPAAAIPAGEGPLLLRLHFDTCRAMPLELLVEHGAGGEGDQAFVSFSNLNDLVEDGLERFVFCHHRRKVAEARGHLASEIVSGDSVKM